MSERATAASSDGSAACGKRSTPSRPVITAGRGKRTNTGWVKCGWRTINCPFSRVASFVLTAGLSTAYPGVASSSPSMRP